MKFSEEFFSYMDTAQAGVAGVSAQIVGHQFDKRLPGWFRIMYNVIRGYTPLVEFCLANFERHPSDEFTIQLRSFYARSLKEETGHDRLMLRDLRKIGVPDQAVNEELPSAAITALVGSQYYLIAHYHPAIFLGYLGLLEGYPPQMNALPELIERSGVGPDAWATYRLHAEEDPLHNEWLREMLDAVPNTRWLRQAIIANGIRSAEYYCVALEELAESAAA